MKKEEAETLKYIIKRASWDRDDYPPYAIAAWDDRNRYQEFIFKVIDEFIEKENIK